MGQYWKVVNLDKKEYVNPHDLGTGLKLWEQLANHPGTGAALIILCAAMPEPRGGGDFDLTENWHGPERKLPEHGAVPGPMPESYPEIVEKTIGRWSGDRIALVGDCADDDDLPAEFQASTIYSKCIDPKYFEEDKEFFEEKGISRDDLYTDISWEVAAVIEHELNGKYVGEGWKNFEKIGG